MMAKEILDAIIQRRIDEGKTLSIYKINDEKYTEWALQEAAVKYYGSWTEARAAHEVEITKESVAKEILRLQKEGHSMKSGDFDPRFYRQIRQTFGGYQQAKTELGIVTKKKGGSGLKKRNLDDVIKETRLAVAEVKDWGEFYEKYRYLTDYSRARTGSMNEVFTLAGVKKPQRGKPKRVRSKWTLEFTKTELERVATEYGSVSANFLKEQGFRSLVDAVRSHYGTWNAGLIALGYEVACETPKEDLSKDEITAAALKALAKGTRPVTEEIGKEVRGFNRVLSKVFGGYDKFKEYAGYCVLADKPPVKIVKVKKYSPTLKNAAGIQREITRLWYIGEPLNYRYTRETRGHLITAANKHIGSWREAIESVGIDYEDVSIDIDTNILSECGYEFEDVVAEILDELGTKFTRDGHEHLRPDFITEEGRWIDAKLSEWTDISEMLKKYDDHHCGLTVIYLRGKDMRRNRGVKWKYEHVSVYQLIRGMPKWERSYFEGKLDAIKAKADACAVAN